jgi:hypothetical protein
LLLAFLRTPHTPAHNNSAQQDIARGPLLAIIARCIH